MFHSQSSSSGMVSSTLEEVATPALLNTAPIGRGAQSATSPAKSRCASASATSSTRSSVGPLLEPGLGLLEPLLVDVGDRDGQLWAESRCASARPMPDAAPLMTTVRPLMVPFFCLCVLLRVFLVTPGGAESGVVSDEVDDFGPTRPMGRSWPRPADGLQAGSRDRSRGCRPASGVDHPLRSPWMTRVGTSMWCEFGGAVA